MQFVRSLNLVKRFDIFRLPNDFDLAGIVEHEQTIHYKVKQYHHFTNTPGITFDVKKNTLHATQS